MQQQTERRFHLVRSPKEQAMLDAMTADGRRLYWLISADRTRIRELTVSLRIWVILALVGWGIVAWGWVKGWSP